MATNTNTPAASARSSDRMAENARRGDQFMALRNRLRGEYGLGGGQKPGGGRRRPPAAPPTQNTGGGGGGGGAPAPAPTDPYAAISNEIRDKALALMRGDESRYSDKRVSDMKDQMFESTIGRVKQTVRSLDAGLTRRGMFRSGISARAETDIRNNALQAYSRGVKEIMMKKIDAEFEDKMKGMAATQTWLSQKQNYDLGKERNVIAREQIAAQMAAARLSAQVSREGIAAANGRARASLMQQREFHIDSLARGLMGGASYE